MADKNKTGDFYTRPEKATAKSLWDSDKGEFLGRNASSWGKILGFYVIFYIVLALFAGGLFALFNTTLNDERPKWLLDESLIGSNPGLGFRPMPPEDNPDSTLIFFSNREKWTDNWVKTIDEFLAPFEEIGSNEVDCAKNKPESGKVCKVDIKNAFGPCNRENSYGYLEKKPCIFLKLNKIFSWKPEYYDKNDLPGNMPDTLKSHIQKASTNEVVWVSCEGEYPADKEHIGELQYFTSQGNFGFNGNFYPFEKQDGYKQPLVAVQFKNATQGVIINIECKAWAKNIEHDRKERRGSVHLELMIDDGEFDKNYVYPPKK